MEVMADRYIGQLPVWAILIISCVIIIIGCCLKLCISVINNLLNTGQNNSNKSSKTFKIYSHQNRDFETNQINGVSKKKEEEENIPKEDSENIELDIK